jgi:hypothetical protein
LHRVAVLKPGVAANDYQRIGGQPDDGGSPFLRVFNYDEPGMFVIDCEDPELPAALDNVFNGYQAGRIAPDQFARCANGSQFFCERKAPSNDPACGINHAGNACGFYGPAFSLAGESYFACVAEIAAEARVKLDVDFATVRLHNGN